MVSQVWLFAKEQNIYLKFVGFPTNLSPPRGCNVFILTSPKALERDVAMTFMSLGIEKD